MKAKLIKDHLPNFAGHAALYELDPPTKESRFVVVSAVDLIPIPNYRTCETYVFAANENGEVLSWSELAAALDVKDHAAALKDLGYELC